MSVLRTADDFRDLMLAYLEHASRDGVRHAEVFFDPQVHVANGLDFDMVLDGLLAGLREGRERFGVSGALILSIVRDLPVEDAEHMVDVASSRADDILGIGLDSAERGYPPELFSHVFERARALGWRCVAHAGEEGPASYITQALDCLHAERIDHASHALDDMAVMARLAEERVPVTRCPLSNLRLHGVERLEDLRIRDFMDAGVITTVNADDPAYFGGYLLDNYAARPGASGRHVDRGVVPGRDAQGRAARRVQGVGSPVRGLPGRIAVTSGAYKKTRRLSAGFCWLLRLGLNQRHFD